MKKLTFVVATAVLASTVAEARPSKVCRQYDAAEAADRECRTRMAVALNEPWNDKMTSSDVETEMRSSCGDLDALKNAARTKFYQKNERRIRALYPKFAFASATPSDWAWVLSSYSDICEK